MVGILHLVCVKRHTKCSSIFESTSQTLNAANFQIHYFSSQKYVILIQNSWKKFCLHDLQGI